MTPRQWTLLRLWLDQPLWTAARVGLALALLVWQGWTVALVAVLMTVRIARRRVGRRELIRVTVL